MLFGSGREDNTVFHRVKISTMRTETLTRSPPEYEQIQESIKQTTVEKP